MRIANNIMAMNTHRQYTLQNDKVANSAEKLSSGYKINRAADDAAGLAISEKMRSQIRGLNRASLNSQDASSLIQTAEGALQEVHSMLQRMNELAVQSATGTNQNFDRTQVAKEFDQLKREINDISEQSTFNNMKILDGSLSAEGLKRSALTSGIYATYDIADPATGAGGVKDISTTLGKNFQAGYKATFDIDLAGLEMENVVGGETVKITVGGQTLTSGALTAGDSSAVQIAQAFKNQTVTIGGVDYTASATAGSSKVTLVADDPADISKETLNGYALTAQAAKTGTGNFVAGKDTMAGTTIINPAAGKADSLGTIATSQFKYDVSSVKSGDKFTIGDQTYTFFSTAAGDKAPATNGIDIDTVNSASALADRINDVLGTGDITAPTDVTVAAVGDNISMTYAGLKGQLAADDPTVGGAFGLTGNNYVKVTSTPAKIENSGTTKFEFDLLKMKDGDTVTWNDGTTEFNYVKRSDSTVAEMAAAFGISTDNVSGNTISFANSKDIRSQISFKAAPDYNKYEEMKIQVGALEGEQLSIRIGAMNTAGLGLDDSSIFNAEDASKAITSVRDAVNQVSDQRALLGAMQNRMTYKINNLKISAENLQAAESRIRDVDIASEMTNFTKSNIMAQAATAMLAQANSAPQNVLSLLR